MGVIEEVRKAASQDEAFGLLERASCLNKLADYVEAGVSRGVMDDLERKRKLWGVVTQARLRLGLPTKDPT